MKIIRDCFGRSVRLTDERTAHILQHQEMAEMESEIERVLQAPAEVRVSRLDNTGEVSGSGMSIDLFVDLKLGHSPFLEASARCPFCSDCGWLAILGGALSVRNRFQESASLIACGVALAGE